MSTVAAAPVTGREDEKSLQDELAFTIILADRIIKSAQDSESFKQDCFDLAFQVNRLSELLRSAVRFTCSTSSLYDRPLRRIISDITKNLDRALTLARKCKHNSVLRQLFYITSIADFRKVSNLIESSIGDMKWLLPIFESEGSLSLSLPPIASNDPVLACVWTSISTIQMGQIMKDRTDAAYELACLAKDSDRNKIMIMEERGVLPLLKLLKDGFSFPDAQAAAVSALTNIATDRDRVRSIIELRAAPVFVSILGDSNVKVQIAVANLVARMAALDTCAQEEFAEQNATRPLVSLLSNDLVLSSNYNTKSCDDRSDKTSFLRVVQMNRESAYENNRVNSETSSSACHGSTQERKDCNPEPPELRLRLKVSCALALWKLSAGSVSNSKKITEKKGLLCLAKIIEKEKGDLQLNCLMTVMEITAVAETNVDLRRAAFKTNCPPAKAILDQLLRVIQEEDDDPVLQIPAIRSIGCLARTFPARETRIIGTLVACLGHSSVEVATEAVIALGKFACPENFNCSQHSQAIIQSDGVPPLMKLIRIGGEARVSGLVLLCYLALNAGDSRALGQARALNTLQGTGRPVVSQHPELRDLFAKAIHQLILYHAGAHPHKHSSASV